MNCPIFLHRLHTLPIVLALVMSMRLALFASPIEDTTTVGTHNDSLRSRSVWKTMGDDLSISVSDAGTIFTAPLHFNEHNMVMAGALTVATVALIPFDSTGRRIAKANQSPANDKIATVGRWYGDTRVGAGIALGTYFGGLAFGSDQWRTTGRMMLQSLVYAGLVSTVMKVMFGRSRPYANEGPYEFRGPQFNTEHTSFISGHSTVAFAVSSVLAQRIANPVAYVICYGMATLTAASRIYNDAHWISDTFLGGAMGTVIGYAVVHLHDDASSSQSWNVVPSLDGITLVGRF